MERPRKAKFPDPVFEIVFLSIVQYKHSILPPGKGGTDHTQADISTCPYTIFARFKTCDQFVSAE